MTLSDTLTELHGVGAQTAAKFARLHIHTIYDLMYFLPRRYEDFTHVVAINQVTPGHISVRAKVQEISTRRVRRGLHITEAVLSDATGKMRAVWFNQPYRIAQLQEKGQFVFTGMYNFQRNRYVLQNPSAMHIDHAGGSKDGQAAQSSIVPIYPETKGLKSHTIRQVVAKIIPLMVALPELLPAEVIEHQQLISHSESLIGLHAPQTQEQLARARERFAFDELFGLLLASYLNKQENERLPTWHIPFDRQAAKKFVTQLSFTLTDAQRRSIWEIIKNFEAGTPMNRLLQGDVGAGKTVVAAMAAYLAHRSGYQTALMAPTEILATQHARTLETLLEPFDVNVALLVGATTSRIKSLLNQKLASGTVDVIVGTHALIQQTVVFKKLGFVIIDEQHRFGVRQRAELLTKSERMPHLLAMSATPIPRSLALTVYGELDISILDERPSGRQPIVTEICSPNSRTQLYTKIDAELAAGHQAYVICPLVDHSDTNAELKSVEVEYKRLKASVFRHRRISKLHGQMTTQAKETVMEQFAAGTIDILISTTVVEVGVDVPNATVMIIEGADRFGLAQLHQLRGRVGRSSRQSYCYLIPSTSAKPSARLREMVHSNDGFYLAERDLALRGPGEIYGRMQHGELNLQVASLADTQLVKRAQTEALWCVQNNLDLLQYPQLEQRVGKYRRLTTLQ